MSTGLMSTGLMSTAVLCTPLRAEQLALRGAGRRLHLIRTGMGPTRAAAIAARLPKTTPVLIAGLAAAQTPHIQPADVVVATEVRTSAAQRHSTLGLPNSTAELFDHAGAALLLSSGNAARSAGPGGRKVEIRSAALLAGALRELGLRVHLGVISSVPRVAWGPVADGSIAVDMESAQLAVMDRPCAVVRVVVDTLDHPLWQLGTLRRGVRALRALRACRPALEWWAAATGPREVLLPPPGTGDLPEMDLFLAGSPGLVELAQRHGLPAYLVGDAGDIDLRWLAGRTRIGVMAEAPLAEQIVRCLSGLGPVTVREQSVTREVS